jgi:adenylyltransferase/sulfurtransferase
MAADINLEIDCQSIRTRLQTGEPGLLLDCREPDEYAVANIAGAVLLPMSELPERLSELEAYRQAPLAVHCHHGGRSLKVARWLRQNGFAQAQSMAGGIDEWSREIDPSVPRY